MTEWIKTLRDFQLLDFLGSGATLNWIPTVLITVGIICVLLTRMKVLLKFIISLFLLGGILVILGVIPLTF